MLLPAVTREYELLPSPYITDKMASHCWPIDSHTKTSGIIYKFWHSFSRIRVPPRASCFIAPATAENYPSDNFKPTAATYRADEAGPSHTQRFVDERLNRVRGAAVRTGAPVQRSNWSQYHFFFPSSFYFHFLWFCLILFYFIFIFILLCLY